MSDADTPEESHRAKRSTMIVGVALVVLLVAGGVAFAIARDGGDGPWSSYADGWTELPLPPGAGHATYAWTGSKVVAWDAGSDALPGGSKTAFTLDPASKTWTSTATAPTTGSIWAVIWTGSDVLYFLGAGHDGLQVVGFDPERNAWDTFEKSPPGLTLPSSFTWTGRDVIMFGGSVDREHGSDRASSFDPASDAWTSLPPAPVPMSAPATAWSGQELIAAGWSGHLLHPSTDSLQTIAYDPASSSWETLPDSGLGIVDTGAVAVDGRPILWQPGADSSREWQGASRSWMPITAGGVDWGGCPVDPAATAGVAFSWNCGHPATFSAATSTWTAVDTPVTIDASVVPYGFTVAAGDGFVVKALVPIVSSSGTADSHVNHLWFWKPPAE